MRRDRPESPCGSPKTGDGVLGVGGVPGNTFWSAMAAALRICVRTMRAEFKFVFVVRASSRGFLDRFMVVGGAGQPVVGSRLWLAPMRFIKCIHKICCERAARVTVWCYRGPTHAGSGGRGAPVGNGNAASAPTRHPPFRSPSTVRSTQDALRLRRLTRLQ